MLARCHGLTTSLSSVWPLEDIILWRWPQQENGGLLVKTFWGSLLWETPTCNIPHRGQGRPNTECMIQVFLCHVSSTRNTFWISVIRCDAAHNKLKNYLFSIIIFNLWRFLLHFWGSQTVIMLCQTNKSPFASHHHTKKPQPLIVFIGRWEVVHLFLLPSCSHSLKNVFSRATIIIAPKTASLYFFKSLICFAVGVLALYGFFFFASHSHQSCLCLLARFECFGLSMMKLEVSGLNPDNSLQFWCI